MKMVKTVESVAKTPKMAGATLGSVPKMAGSVPRPTAWVVPGLAFTRGGVRLGYGGGWYDRMLGVGTDPAQRIGVAYPFQVVEELPSEPHDVRLTGLVVAGEADFKEEEI